MQTGIDTAEFRRGWPALLAALFGNAAGVGAIMYYSMSSFMLPLEREFGWSRSDMGFAVSCLVLGWIVSMPLVGMVCDRIGPRGPILLSIPLLSLVLASLSLLNGSLTMLYVLFFAGAVLGSGTLGVTYIAAVSPWFVANRGLAYGIALAGTGISAFLLPLGLHAVITVFDWRDAWLLLALVVLLQWPIAWVCIGKRAPSSRPISTLAGSGVEGYTLAEAMRTKNFWILAAAFLVIALLLSGLIINLIPMLTESGLAADQAASAAAGIGVGLLFARVFVGYLLDRMPARMVAAVAFAIAAGGCTLLDTSDPVRASAGALALGFTAGSELDLLAYMTARYFGTRFHASIYAVSLSLFYVGAVLAPVLVGELYAYAGDYTLVLNATIASCVVAGLLVFALGSYPEFSQRLHMQEESS